MKIAYLGPETTFTHKAALELFGTQHKFRSAKTIADVFYLVRDRQSDHGVIPIENSNAGTVSEALNIFCREDYKLKITNELFLKIDFHLLSQARKISGIKLIYAHEMAIKQCDKWLARNAKNKKIEKVESNAQAAKLACENQNTAAISNTLSAQKYNLEILKKNITDYDDSTTRFLVLSKINTKPTNNDKTSLLFSLKHKPGALYHFLAPLAKNNINFIKIESRIMRIPVRNKTNWEYHFFLDIEGHYKDKKIQEAICEMKTHCLKLKILGSYPRGKTPWG